MIVAAKPEDIQSISSHDTIVLCGVTPEAFLGCLLVSDQRIVLAILPQTRKKWVIRAEHDAINTDGICCSTQRAAVEGDPVNVHVIFENIVGAPLHSVCRETRLIHLIVGSACFDTPND